MELETSIGLFIGFINPDSRFLGGARCEKDNNGSKEIENKKG